MSLIEGIYKSWVRPGIFARSTDNAEIAHRWGLDQLIRMQRSPMRLWLAQQMLVFRHPMLQTRVFGVNFANPLGLAAGFDKYCEVYHSAIPACGWGFAEVGGITPLRQEGFPEPRMLRSVEYAALWNMMGFNNPGARHAAQLMSIRSKAPIPVGLNIGKGKDTPLPLAAQDYVAVVRELWWFVDFITVNISSPNTKDLRNLQAVQFLLGLLQAVQEENFALERHHGSKAKPVGFKISPDETDKQLADMITAARAAHVSFIILTNTTVKRDSTAGWNIPGDRGGVSGKPLAPAALRVLQRVARELHGEIPLIAVGGISSGDELYDRILNGASLC